MAARATIGETMAVTDFAVFGFSYVGQDMAAFLNGLLKMSRISQRNA